MRRHISDIAFYSIYRPRKDERLSWPSWLTYSVRFTHISGLPSAAGRAWDRESSPVKDNVLTTVQRNRLYVNNNIMILMNRSILFFVILWGKECTELIFLTLTGHLSFTCILSATNQLRGRLTGLALKDSSSCSWAAGSETTCQCIGPSQSPVNENICTRHSHRLTTK